MESTRKFAAGESKWIVDCDIHNAVTSEADLKPYLSARWRRHMEVAGYRTYSPYHRAFVYPRATPGAARVDAWPSTGGPPGSDLELMREQLLDRYPIEHGILICLYRAAEQRNVEYGAALAQAVNAWQAEHWLEHEPRLSASVVVAFENPESAAKEIRRVAGQHRFVQVLLLPRTRQPLGQSRYWTIYEAACEAGLPIALHVSTIAPGPVTPAGWPSYFIEDHTSLSLNMQAQVTSLVMEGALERFPELKVVLIEGGFAWLPSLCWRLDTLYHRLRDEVPYLTSLPSEYIAKHFRMTTQPMEEPSMPAQIVPVIEQVGAHMLMFASDYPHWDFDNPLRAFQSKIPAEIRQQVFAANAREFYGLPAA